jgi:hypothetical protein
MIGIYKIENIKNNHCYIGSSVKIEDRWRRHKKDLRKGNHHSIILQRAWDKYGEDEFKLIILEECKKEEMKDRENHYLFTFLPVYNICKEAYSTIGREYKEETRIKHKQYAKENNIKPPKETYEGRYIPIIQLNKETGEEIEEFKSVSEACFAIGKNYKFVSTLTDVCRGKRKSAFGYKWKFKNGSEIKINNSECGS